MTNFLFLIFKIQLKALVNYFRFLLHLMITTRMSIVQSTINRTITFGAHKVPQTKTTTNGYYIESKICKFLKTKQSKEALH